MVLHAIHKTKTFPLHFYLSSPNIDTHVLNLLIDVIKYFLSQLQLKYLKDQMIFQKSDRTFLQNVLQLLRFRRSNGGIQLGMNCLNVTQ